MSDIHVLEGVVQADDVFKIDTTLYRFVMHLPTNADAALKAKAVQCPAVGSFSSALGSLIEQAELDDIQAGELLEEIDSIHYTEGQAAGDYLAAVRARYALRAVAAPEVFTRKYRWYGDDYASE